MTELLEVRELSKSFGGLIALDNVSFSIGAGEIFGMIGPNGAGKTTLFNLITRTLRASRGQVVFEGKPLSGGPDAVARRGIIRTFQATTIFKDTTVANNIERAWFLRNLYQPAQLFLNSKVKAADVESAVFDILRLLDLERVSERRAGDLPYGLQKLLGVGLALVAHPTLLLLDEPAAGLNSTEKKNLGGLLRKIRERGITIAIVEHDVPLIMSTCDRILVLNYGRRLALGTASEIRSDRLVEEAYLGGAYELS